MFVIADFKKPILGADFLGHFGLLVDKDAIYTYRASSPLIPRPKMLPTPISHSLKSDTPVKQHHIKTTGSAPDCLQAAKSEFEHMLQLLGNHLST